MLDRYSRVTWVDADVLIWAPGALKLPDGPGPAFVAERWMERWHDGSLRFRANVSNYLCSFSRGDSFLDRHIDEVLDAIRRAPMPVKLGVAGTSLLTTLATSHEFELVQNVANFSPVLMDSLLDANFDEISAYEVGLPEPLSAANLCLSHAHRPFQGREPRPERPLRIASLLVELARPVWPSEVAARIH